MTTEKKPAMTTRKLCLTAIGIALYVAVSMLIKIPVTAHISLDLGYVVLAAYCYIYGPFSGAVVGACGCFLVSLLATAWPGTEWALGNLFIGAACGIAYNRTKGMKHALLIDLAVTVASVFIGIGVIKTVAACLMYQLPFWVKFVRNCVAFAMDAVVMCLGIPLATKLQKIVDRTPARAGD